MPINFNNLEIFKKWVTAQTSRAMCLEGFVKSQLQWIYFSRLTNSACTNQLVVLRQTSQSMKLCLSSSHDCNVSSPLQSPLLQNVYIYLGCFLFILKNHVCGYIILSTPFIFGVPLPPQMNNNKIGSVWKTHRPALPLSSNFKVMWRQQKASVREKKLT